MRPSVEAGCVGWVVPPARRRRDARGRAALLVGEHDFSVVPRPECQALSPVKTMRALAIERRGAYWRFDFEADAFLHHMIRNIMGCLLAVGQGQQPPAWMAEVLAARDRDARRADLRRPTACTSSGPYYDAAMAICPSAPLRMTGCPERAPQLRPP